MNHSLITADRGARLRMVMASLACVIVFMAALIASEISGNAGGNARFAGATVVKAGQATAVANHETSRIVR